MVVATPVCYNPSSRCLAPNLPRQRFCHRSSFADSFSASRSNFFPRRPLSLSRGNRLLVQNNMDELVKTYAIRDNDSDEGVQVLEQESLIDGSSQLGFKFPLRELEPTLNRLSKWMVSAFFGALILWRHDAESLWFAAGSILNAVFSVVLKRILNQERPSTLKSDPGMPSTHGQSIFFFVTFAILSSVEWLGLSVSSIIISGLALALGSYFSYLRVSQQLHTASQVVVGAIVGSIDSILWYWLWNAFVLDAFVSSQWVRVAVVLGSAGICFGFVIYVIRHWLKDD
ncbi:lipid phosphate phosphatase epsilon 1, chloroplastic [Prosopis cineraria]|uniref:lipid phosphate phosphatase epsilon 1, chloroplastic n=1 Tax=Prosopis cineraria TaxID=364024 RepID=UPI00240F68AC|nr:lipid phosphate phosphatase epsilon 1, chloroplastic [Prosopis cineraria]